MKVDLTENALKVLQARYLLRDAKGRVIETPEELFRRVARGVAEAETRFGGPEAAARWEEAFAEALAQLDFLPNSPTLMNAGTPLGQLSACFVLPIEDSIGGIFDSLKRMALIQKTGDGTGVLFLAPPAQRRSDRQHRRSGFGTGLVHAYLRLRHREHVERGETAWRQHGRAAR